MPNCRSGKQNKLDNDISTQVPYEKRILNILYFTFIHNTCYL